MKTNTILAGALGAVSLLAIAATVYGLRARDSAIRGWGAWASANEGREKALADLSSQSKGAATLAARVRAAEEFEKMIVARDTGLPLSGAIDPHDANAAVRDYVYRTNVVGPGSFPFKGNDQRYGTLGKANAEQLCHGMALAQEWALTRLGVPARTVVLAGENFLAGKDRFETHAFTEVWLDGKWQISDPTFNVSVNCSDGGEYLSVPEAAACIRNGGRLVGIPGKTQIAGRSIADYYAPYETFFAAYERGPVNLPPVKADKEEYPQPGWIQKSLLKYRPQAAPTAASQ